jgi:hypothetical protein
LFKKRVDESNWWKFWCQSEFPSLRMQPACSILEKELETGTSASPYKGLYRILVTSNFSADGSLFKPRERYRGEMIALLDVWVAGSHLLSQCIDKGIKSNDYGVWSLECQGKYETEAITCLVIGAALAQRAGNQTFVNSQTSLLVTISLKFLHKKDGTLQNSSIQTGYVHPRDVEYGVFPQQISGREGQRRLEEGFLFMKEPLRITGSCYQLKDHPHDMGAGALGVRAPHKQTALAAVFPCTYFKIVFTAGAKFDGRFTLFCH